ncbi:MAG: c-type cytochrome domain-containing protein [Bdellovibrio sp.]
MKSGRPASLKARSRRAAPSGIEPTFESIKAQVIDKICLTCHKAGGRASSIPLETKEEVLKGSNEAFDALIVPGKAEESAFYLSLLPDEAARKGIRKMPTARAVQAKQVEDITPEEIKAVEEWINRGAP